MIKTNATNLMTLLNEKQKELNNIEWYLRSNCTNEKTLELNGKEVDLKIIEDFDEKMVKSETLLKEIHSIKGALAKHNTENILNYNGLSIAQNLIVVSNLRKHLDTLNQLLEYKPIKKRISEQNNSYYLVKTPVFDAEKIKEKKEEIEKIIRNIEAEINELNSKVQDFNINIES